MDVELQASVVGPSMESTIGMFRQDFFRCEKCPRVGQSERGTPNGAQPCNITDFTLFIDIKGPITI